MSSLLFSKSRRSANLKHLLATVLSLEILFQSRSGETLAGPQTNSVEVDYRVTITYLHFVFN